MNNDELDNLTKDNKMNDFKEELLNKIEHEFWVRDISDQEKVMFALNVIQKLWIDFEGTLTLNDVVIKSIVFKDTEVKGVNEDE